MQTCNLLSCVVFTGLYLPYRDFQQFVASIQKDLAEVTETTTLVSGRINQRLDIHQRTFFFFCTGPQILIQKIRFFWPRALWKLKQFWGKLITTRLRASRCCCNFFTQKKNLTKEFFWKKVTQDLPEWELLTFFLLLVSNPFSTCSDFYCSWHLSAFN